MASVSQTRQAPRNGKSMPSESRPVTVPDFLAAKERGVKLCLLTAYDYTMARLLETAGVDGVLVGDSLGMVVQGQENSLAVTLEEMIYHSRMVARALRRSLLIVDMPFMSFQVSPRQALKNAGRLIKEGQAHAVKVEGGVRSAAAIAAITKMDIPVMGHIGLTPQSIRRLGGFRVQRQEKQLMEDALATQEAGAFAVVLECIPAATAQNITQALHIPTIGIGAGSGCDGQVLVTHDMLGLFSDLSPRFVKHFGEIGQAIVEAVTTYCQEVREGTFPAEEHEFR